MRTTIIIIDKKFPEGKPDRQAPDEARRAQLWIHCENKMKARVRV